MSQPQLKKIHRIVSPREEHWVGNGFHVSTLFSVGDQPYRLISPFILMDHAAPRHFPVTQKKYGVGEHPHRGFETVTFAIQGEIEHRDSGGGGGTITTGGVQWMTAGSGVVHDEFHSRDFARAGGQFEMVQLWVNLPAKDKMTTPKYQSLEASKFPTVELEGGRANATLIAGELGGQHGPAKTHTPINIFRVENLEDGPLHLDFKEGSNTLIFVLKGRCKIEGQPMPARNLALFEREGERVALHLEKDTHLLVLNGEPIDEPIAHYGPFVMNNKKEIEQAIADFRDGKMGRLVQEGDI